LAVAGSKKFQDLIAVSIQGEPENLVLDVARDEPAIDTAVLTLGKSYLMTSRDDMAAEDVVWAYRQQYLIEDAFKRLKNPSMLSIRPMYHWTDASIRGHAFSCFLGLLLLSLLVRELQHLGIKMGLRRIVKQLKSLRLTRITITGKQEPVQKVDKMSPEAKIIFDALDLQRYVR
jgi:transposase